MIKQTAEPCLMAQNAFLCSDMLTFDQGGVIPLWKHIDWAFLPLIFVCAPSGKKLWCIMLKSNELEALWFFTHEFVSVCHLDEVPPVLWLRDLCKRFVATHNSFEQTTSWWMSAKCLNFAFCIWWICSGIVPKKNNQQPLAFSWNKHHQASKESVQALLFSPSACPHISKEPVKQRWNQLGFQHNQKDAVKKVTTRVFGPISFAISSKLENSQKLDQFTQMLQWDMADVDDLTSMDFLPWRGRRIIQKLLAGCCSSFEFLMEKNHSIWAVEDEHCRNSSKKRNEL